MAEIIIKPELYLQRYTQRYTQPYYKFNLLHFDFYKLLKHIYKQYDFTIYLPMAKSYVLFTKHMIFFQV